MGELESRIGDMRPQHLAMCLRSLAQMSCHPGTDFLAAAQRQAVGWSRRFRRFEICGLLWAFASCGARPEELLGVSPSLLPHESPPDSPWLVSYCFWSAYSALDQQAGKRGGLAREWRGRGAEGSSSHLLPDGLTSSLAVRSYFNLANPGQLP